MRIIRKSTKTGNALIYGKGLYRIGEEIRAIGIGRKFINEQDFNNGKVEHWKMKNTQRTPIDELGTFERHTENLIDRMEKYREMKEEFDSKEIYVDEYEKDISYFIKTGTGKEKKIHSFRPFSNSS